MHGDIQPQETNGYGPKNEHNFLQYMFVCNQIITNMMHILLCFLIFLTILIFAF